MTDHVTVSQDGGVLLVTLNRPEKKNALTGAMYDAIDRALAGAATEPSVRVVLISGSGSAFTSGNDLQDFATWGQINDVEEIPVVRVIRRVLAFPKPLVAAVHGVAVGFGTTLLLHCDAVIATSSATFSLPFVKLGLVPEFGSTLLLQAIAGRLRASHKLLLGESFDLAEATAMGLVTATCTDEALAEQSLASCRQFAALPPGALRTIKALINGPEERQRLERAIDAELVQFMKGLRSAEHQEALDAFMAKRRPDFSRFE
jgi:enoyl-CoA hydratase/carnithine racemase